MALFLLQDAVKVEIKIDKGFKAEVEVVSKFGEEVSESAWLETVHETRDGAAVQLEQAFTKHRKNDKPTSLEGKTVVFSATDGARCKIEAPEGVDPNDLRDLGLRAEALRRSLPKEAIEVGREWEVDEKEAIADVNDNGWGMVCESAKLKCKLIRVENGNAVVRMAGETKSKDGVVTKVENFYHISIEKKYVVAVESSGTVGEMRFESKVKSVAK
jgi:hypothetical protein